MWLEVVGCCGLLDKNIYPMDIIRQEILSDEGYFLCRKH
nr:MAG TPA: hypothetical protein [Caudoviricetes sp.]